MSCFSHVVEALLVLDRMHPLVDVTEWACELSGYTREELVGLSLTDLLLDSKEVSRIFKELTQTKNL